MTHQHLITTPDIDLMQLAERQDCEPSLKKRILAHLATLGAPTVIRWLRDRGDFAHARLGNRVRDLGAPIHRRAKTTPNSALEFGATRAEVLNYADTL